MKYLVCMLLCSLGCGVNIEPPYLLDHVKVVAVVAAPPDIGPGQSTALRAVVAAVHIPQPTLSARWSFCKEHDVSGTQSSCSDAITLEGDNAVPLTPGIYSVGATYQADPMILGDIPTLVVQAGFWVNLLAVIGTPGSPLTQTQKRVVVSGDSLPRNINPQLNKVDVWDRGAITGAGHPVHTQSNIELVPDYDPASFQAYQVLASDGSWKPRIESAQFTWYVSAGTLNSWVTQGNASVIWTLPKSAINSQQQFITVLRDGRGGTAAIADQVVVLP